MSPLVHVLVLADCGNACQAFREMQFKGDFRMGKIHLYIYIYILRDFTGEINLTYVTVRCNISDAGTQLEIHVVLFHPFSFDSRFSFAFFRRREFQPLQNAPEAHRSSLTWFRPIAAPGGSTKK